MSGHSDCKWATQKEQSNNTRRSVRLEHNGENMTLSEWADYLNMNRTTLRERISAGWSTEKALTLPVKTQRRAK